MTFISWKALCISAGQCKNHILQLQQRGFVVEESRCWIGCLQSRYFTNREYWHIIKRKIHQRRPRTLQQLETYIRHEWDQIPTPKLQKFLTSIARRLQTVSKRRGDATPCNMSSSQLFGICSRHRIWNELILCIQFLSSNIMFYVNKILAHVIWNCFSFHFIQISKTSQVKI